LFERRRGDFTLGARAPWSFELVAAMLCDPAFDLDAIWEHANDRERRVLIEELIETVTIHADRLDVTVAGAPALLVTLDEVGLRFFGTGGLVSEHRVARSRTTDWDSRRELRKCDLGHQHRMDGGLVSHAPAALTMTWA
jgi:hypothetical protein